MGKGSKIESNLCLIPTLSQTLSATSRCFLGRGLQTSLVSPFPMPDPHFHEETPPESGNFLPPLYQKRPPTPLALLLMFAQDPPATRTSCWGKIWSKCELEVDLDLRLI